MLRYVELCASVMALSLSPTAEAQPAVVHHAVKDAPFMLITTDDGWQTIVGSDRSVTVPAGVAVITWSVVGGVGAPVEVRPFVGGSRPTEGMWTGVKSEMTYLSHSWTTATAGGTFNVGLEAMTTAGENSFGGGNHSMSWTLMVFPNSTLVSENTPAVSAVGMVALTAILLAVGAAMIRNNRPGTS